jgi:hypothetical protein
LSYFSMELRGFEPPAKAVFEAVAVPLASPWTRGVTWRGLRTVAFDDLNSVKVPDSDRNRSWLGKLKNRLGLAGYPAMRIVALAETGTRGLLGAATGGTGERAEVPLARKLVPLPGEGMLLLADRAYGAAGLLAAIAATGAHFLVRGSVSRKPEVSEILPGGSYLSQVDGLPVRIIEADLDVHGADGTRIGNSCRLITTLLDWRRYHAGELIRPYHERREIEVAYLALRHTLLGGYVLRSRDRAGAGQELWGLLAVCQALRMAMTGAAEPPEPTRAGAASPSRWRPPATRSPQPAVSRTPQIPATPAGSAVPSWLTCCPPAARATAPARSNAPRRATTSGTRTVTRTVPASP